MLGEQTPAVSCKFYENKVVGAQMCETTAASILMAPGSLLGLKDYWLVSIAAWGLVGWGLYSMLGKGK